MKKVRVIQYLVKPVIVVDDGSNLVPLDVQPITVPAERWDVFVATGLQEALTQLDKEQNAVERPAPLVPLHPAVNGKAKRKAALS